MTYAVDGFFVIIFSIFDLITCSIIFFIKKAFLNSDSLKDTVKELHEKSFDLFMYWFLFFVALRIIFLIIDPIEDSFLGNCYDWLEHKRFIIGFMIAAIHSFVQEIKWAKEQHNSKVMRNTIETILILLGICFYIIIKKS